LDDIINTVNELVFQAVNAIEESLLSADVENLGFSRDGSSGDVDTIARTEIEAGIVQLESLLNATIDRNFDKLEIYTLRNLLTVSNLKEDEGLESWVMLDHYKDIDHTSNDRSNSVTPESLAMLRRKVQETEKLQAMLKAEAARNDAILARLKPLSLEPQQPEPQRKSLLQSSSPTKATGEQQPSFSFLAQASAANAMGIGPNTTSQSLSQNTKFTLSQLPALKALLQELRPHVASMPKIGAGTEAAQARDAYIETQSRRAMARKGIDSTSSAGAGAEDMGRSLGSDEVKSLESIVGETGVRGATDSDKMEE